MGITINCYPKKIRQRMLKHIKRYRLKSTPYTYKQYNKHKVTTNLNISIYVQTEIKEMFENELYELVSQIAHVRKYIRNMKFEYCGETAEEIEIYWLTIDDLHHSSLKHYHESTKDERELRYDHLEYYKKEYNAFMDEVGITYDNVYEYLFDFPDDGGYQTPPKKIKQLQETYDELEQITSGICAM